VARKNSRRQVTVGLVQMSAGEDIKRNLDKAVAGIDLAAKKGAGVVCLQELFRSRYFPQVEDAGNFKLAETIPGPTTDALGGVAKKKKVVVIAPLFEKRSAGIYHNTAVVIGADGSILGK